MTDLIYDLRLIHPARFIIHGPSCSGKSTFVWNLLKNSKQLFGFNFDSITYVSGRSFPKENSVNGKIIRKLTNFVEDDLKNINSMQNNIIIFDDNMNVESNDPLLSDMFTNMSHHLNITIIFIMQNLFPKGKFMKDISVNATYIVLMSNPRDKLQIKTLSYQIDGDSGAFYFNCFKDATKNNPFSYLFLDFNQTTPDALRVRTNIFPNDEPKIVYKKRD